MKMSRGQFGWAVLNMDYGRTVSSILSLGKKLYDYFFLITNLFGCAWAQQL